MADLEKILQAIKLAEQNLTNYITNINTAVNEKTEQLEANITAIKNLQSELEKKCEQYEIEERRNNIVIFGIPEVEKGYFDLERTVLKLINEKVGVNCSSDHISFVKRFGTSTELIRPVKVGLTTWNKKLQILNNMQKLLGSEIYINVDLTKNALEERQKLKPIMNTLKKEGKHAFLRHDKLWVDGKLYNGIYHDEYSSTNPDKNINKINQHHINKNPEVELKTHETFYGSTPEKPNYELGWWMMQNTKNANCKTETMLPPKNGMYPSFVGSDISKHYFQ